MFGLETSIALIWIFASNFQEPSETTRWLIEFEREGDLFAIPTDGKEARRLAAVPKLALDTYRRSTLSPDGKTWACVVTDDGDAEIGVCDAQGLNPLRITENESIDNMPSWCGNSREFCYASTQGGTWQIWIAKSDGKSARKITNCPGGAWEPRCHPTADEVAYVELVGEPPVRTGKLVVCKLDGSKTRTLVEGVTLREFSWSPDGKFIACSLPGTVVLIDAATGKEAEKISLRTIDPELAQANIRFITWRPDGKVIAGSVQLAGNQEAGKSRHNGILVWERQKTPTLLPEQGRARLHRWRKAE